MGPNGNGNASQSSPRVLLTGGAGFIGSHVAEALLRGGAQVTILDNLDPFYDPARKKENLAEIRKAGSFQFFQADICDRDSLHNLFADCRPEAVIHLAARAGVRPSIEQPATYERTNIAGTLNLLELCRDFPVERFVFGSSSSVYGARGRTPFSEDQVLLRPISPYAATKLAGELLCYTFAHLHQVPAICLRFFTVYGPRQRPDLAIHKFTALMEAGKTIPVFGDGSTGRDYTYVDDIVSGILAAMGCELPSDPSGAPFDVVNLGNFYPVTLNQLIEALELATGKTAIRDPKPAQPGDVPLTWAATGKARRVLNYEPRTRLKEGLQRFVEWYRSTQHIPVAPRGVDPDVAVSSPVR